ncbi:hypothetical protein K0H71_17790 [Bacillus sp. IITD106]|nr:hypothetical protein [Bacillus sp. IITD106]
MKKLFTSLLAFVLLKIVTILFAASFFFTGCSPSPPESEVIMEDDNLSINRSDKIKEPYDSTSPVSLKAEITGIGEKYLEISSTDIAISHIPRSIPVYVNRELVNNYDFEVGEKIEVLYNGIIREISPPMLDEVFHINIIDE